MLDLANIEATYPGTGRFTQFLEYVEQLKPWDGLFIESVTNRRFGKFWTRRKGYERIPDSDPCQANFLRLWNESK
jgi:hypothetical protein